MKPAELGSIAAVFVSGASALQSSAGGVQEYTRDLLASLERAGFSLHMLPYSTDRRIGARGRRWLFRRPYANQVPPSLLGRILRKADECRAKFIFLNGVGVAPIAELLRPEAEARNLIVVLFSFGLESVDYLHAASKNTGLETNWVAKTLGRQLFAERRQRRYIDYVFCMTPFEAEIERWLGAKSVTWLPRFVPSGKQLEWNPDSNRMGCVGTWDHPPNSEGLIAFLDSFDAIAPSSLRFRLVGGPVVSAESIAGRYSCVDYLGVLPDEDLCEEARTWSCFVHPIFCFARGASTKLGVALGWQLPVVTTPAGARGYIWEGAGLAVAHDPGALARLAVSMSTPEIARAARERTHATLMMSPSIEEIADKIKAVLLRPD